MNERNTATLDDHDHINRVLQMRGVQVFNDASHKLNVYGSNVEVDYRGYEVTVENFVRVLTGARGLIMARLLCLHRCLWHSCSRADGCACSGACLALSLGLRCCVAAPVTATACARAGGCARGGAALVASIACAGLAGCTPLNVLRLLAALPAARAGRHDPAVPRPKRMLSDRGSNVLVSACAAQTCRPAAQCVHRCSHARALARTTHCCLPALTDLHLWPWRC